MSQQKLVSVGSDAATAVRFVLASPEAAIRLDKRDVALLVMAEDRMRRSGAASLSVEDLREISSIVSRADSGGGVSETAARNDIARLVDMRILVQGSGSMAGRTTFRLGPVGREIADSWRFIPDDEAERLDAMLGEALVRLTEIAERAEALSEGRKTAWKWADVEHRTGRIVGDGLLRPVERRQGQLDRWQAVMADRVKGMLSANWTEALDSCEATLSEAMRASREMKACIDQGAPRLHNVLEAISDAASGQDRATVDTADEVSAVVNRISEWTTDRFEEWTRFVDSALSFIRSVVRADPGRVLSRMIDLQMQAFCAECDIAASSGDDMHAPWTLSVCRGLPFVRLRDPDADTPPRVVIKRAAPIPLVGRDDTWERIEDAIRAHIGHLLSATGRADIEEVLEPWTDEPVLRLSRIAGEAVVLMTAMGTPVADPSAERTRRRIQITGAMEIDRFSVIRAS